MNIIPLTACILAQNEEDRIEACLASVSFCKELLVIDDNSTDRTKARAQKKGARVLTHEMKSGFAAQRNFGLKSAGERWVLFIDADEIVSDALKREITALFSEGSPMYDAYYLKRRDWWWGRPLRFGELYTAYRKGIIRLVSRSAGIFEGPVHEVFCTNKRVSRLNGFLEHYPHQTVADFIRHVNTYSTMRAYELWKNGAPHRTGKLILFPFGKFIYTYFLRSGFLDGVGGFIYSFMMAFHSFLVRAKLYQYRRWGVKEL